MRASDVVIYYIYFYTTKEIYKKRGGYEIQERRMDERIEEEDGEIQASFRAMMLYQNIYYTVCVHAVYNYQELSK